MTGKIFCFLIALLCFGGDRRMVTEKIEWTYSDQPSRANPALPNVLLIGDSITRAYYPAVAKNLDFYVACLLDEAFQESSAVAEVVRSQSLHGFKGDVQVVGGMTQSNADAAAARCALKHKGEADALRRFLSLFEGVQQPGAW